MIFEQLDFIYMPSGDVSGDVRYFTDVLGARVVFAVEGMGTRVAMVELTDQPPPILWPGISRANVPSWCTASPTSSARCTIWRHADGSVATRSRSRTARCARS